MGWKVVQGAVTQESEMFDSPPFTMQLFPSGYRQSDLTCAQSTARDVQSVQ